MNWESCFESRVADKLSQLVDLREVRVRDGLPIVVQVGNRRYYMSSDGSLFAGFGKATPIAQTCNEIVHSLCQGSVYAFERMLASGYMTLDGGVRVGVCGDVAEASSVVRFRRYTSLCFRIPHQIDMIDDVTIERLKVGNVAVVGPPGSGKTTFIKCFASKVARDSNVLVVDERGELAGVAGCDVISYTDKRYAFSVGVRSMSPDWIVCDELTSADVPAVIRCMQSGVKVIATFHGSGAEDLAATFGSIECFRHVVVLSKADNKFSIIG